MAIIKFKNLNKVYENKVQAVFDFNLEVKDKEFIVLVGPSGCGKSTTLRMLAGLEEITSGELLIGSSQSYFKYDAFESIECLNKNRITYHKVDLKNNSVVTGELINEKLAKNKHFQSGDSFVIFQAKTQDKNAFFTNVKCDIAYSGEIKLIVSTLEKTPNILLEKTLNEGGNEEIDLHEIIAGVKRTELEFKLILNKGQLNSLDIHGDEERLINNVEPMHRDIAMVFQSYALYPHMTVYNNIAFGLKLRHYKKDVIDKLVKETAEILGLTEYLDRKPGQLSGGQRQRVALGRAIVRSPKVFLMDEPLSNLDAKLRVSMRSEIIKIHEKVGATTIYVTHDQTEAMTMATRIVIMKDGWIQQIGTPEEVYNYPENIFVAGFIGSPSMNFINAKYSNKLVHIYDNDGKEVYSFSPTKEQQAVFDSYYKKKLDETFADQEKLQQLIDNETRENVLKFMNEDKERFEKDVKYYENIINNKEIDFILGVRPEDCYLEKDPRCVNPSTSFAMEADVTELLGQELIVYGYLGNNRLVVKLSGGLTTKNHETKSYVFDLNRIHFFDPYTSDRIQ